jgi:hypothetical protein
MMEQMNDQSPLTTLEVLVWENGTFNRYYYGDPYLLAIDNGVPFNDEGTEYFMGDHWEIFSDVQAGENAFNAFLAENELQNNFPNWSPPTSPLDNAAFAEAFRRELDANQSGAGGNKRRTKANSISHTKRRARRRDARRKTRRINRTRRHRTRGRGRRRRT